MDRRNFLTRLTAALTVLPIVKVIKPVIEEKPTPSIVVKKEPWLVKRMFEPELGACTYYVGEPQDPPSKFKFKKET